MDIIIEGKRYPQPKLPRKRKKAAIKAQGRQWYHATRRLYQICLSKGDVSEPICKFWDNSSITPQVVMIQGAPRIINMATRFW